MFLHLKFSSRVRCTKGSDQEAVIQEALSKTIPMEKKCKKAKWLSAEALQIAVKRREAKRKGEKERYIHLECRIPKNSKER